MRTTLFLAFVLLGVAIAQASMIPSYSSVEPQPNRHHTQNHEGYRKSQNGGPDVATANASQGGEESRLANYTFWLTLATAALGGATFLLGAFALSQVVFFAKKERAFVFVKDTGIRPIHGIGGIRGHRFDVVLENGGTTPTKFMHYRVTHTLIDTELPVDFPFANDPKQPDLLGVVGPGGSVTAPEIELDLIDFEEIRTNTKHMYLWGWAEYYDVFWWTKRHRTEFCFKVGVVVDGAGNLRVGMPIHTAHNGADDECYSRIHTFPSKHPHAWWRRLLRARR